MAETLTLFGFADSVYTRAVRLCLAETGLSVDYVETDPFADPPDATLGTVSPFDHVPVLRHGAFVLTETAAILRYLAALSDGPLLIPEDMWAAARMDQVMGIVDAYVYRPMVRQVFRMAIIAPCVDCPPIRCKSALVWPPRRHL